MDAAIRGETVDLFRREDDDAMLRTPTARERSCIAGDECEGVRLGMSGPLVERPTNAELAASASTAVGNDVEPLPGRLCVACLRYWSSYVVVNVRRELGYMEKVAVRYWTQAGVAGEYALEQCFLPRAGVPEGFAVPFVYHIRSCYTPETEEERVARVARQQSLEGTGTTTTTTPAADPTVSYLHQSGYARPDVTVRTSDFRPGFGRGKLPYQQQRLLMPLPPSSRC